LAQVTAMFVITATLLRWRKRCMSFQSYAVSLRKAHAALLRLIMQPHLVECNVMILLFAWLLRRSATTLGSIVLAGAFLIWLCWYTSRVCNEREVEVRDELKVLMKVAAYAEGRELAAVSDFSRSEGAKHFEGVRKRTHCLFAPTALVWGNDWEDDCFGEDALDANVARCLPRFYRFCLDVRAGRALDGFVFEVRGKQYSSDVASFAHTVRRVLTGISDADPSEASCIRKRNVGRRGWYFQFAREPLFVTTFAPCYSESNPRYQFGLHPDSCFVLFQPEESFFRHDLPPDKPRSATNWDKPGDVRDRIRANFRRHGREYRIPETVSYPPAEFIVAPMCPLQDPPVHFWTAEAPRTAEQTKDAQGGAEHASTTPSQPTSFSDL